MQIVTDSGTDVQLSAPELADLNIHIVPLVVTLAEQSYREGVDIEPDEFYHKLVETNQLPRTSQPSAGDFAAIYRQLAATDPDILSIHMSSGLSGTFNSACAGAEMVPEANITLVDTKTLSAGAGWQVEAAARAAHAGWSKERILELVAQLGAQIESIYTLQELKYLIHGGRISHMKGLIASVLNIKPIIGVEKEGGTYVQHGQARSFQRAVKGLVDWIVQHSPAGKPLRIQVAHSQNLEGADLLRQFADERLQCNWLPTCRLSLVLGAHTGPSMVGIAWAPAELWAAVP